MSVARRRLLKGMLASALTGSAVLRTKIAAAAGGAPSFIFALPDPGHAPTHMAFFLGKPYDWDISANIEDPDGDPMTIGKVSELPPGFTIDGAGKRLRWSGVGAEGQTNDLEMSVSDNHGNIALSNKFSIRVFKPNSGTAAAPSAQFVRYPIPLLYGKRPLDACKHIRMAICPLNGRVYVLGGDYNGGLGQYASARWEMWSFDPAAPNAWQLEYPYFGPAGEVQPAGPDEATFDWDPLRKMFISGPGGYNYGSGVVRPGFATGIGRSNLCGFNPLTKKWTDLGSIIPSPQSAVASAVYGQLVGRELIGGFDADQMWWVNVDDFTQGLKISPVTGYVGYSEQSAYDGAHTIYFYDYRGRLIKGDTITKTLELVMGDLPSASRLFVNMVWNSDEKLLEVWLGNGATGFGQLIAIDPATKQWWALGSDARGNVMIHYPGKGTIMIGGGVGGDHRLDRISKVIVTRASTGKVPPVVAPPVPTSGWWSGVPKNTWYAIPGTTYTTDHPRAPYTALGTKGRWGDIHAYGGFAADRLHSRFLWAAAGGGAGSWSGNEGGEFNLKVPGVNMLFPPDDAGSLWTLADVGNPPVNAWPLNKYGRPNSTHVCRSLVYSPRTKTLFKFSHMATWEFDAGNFGNTFEARVEGAMGWEPSDKHPGIPGFAQASLDWRLVDWRNGDMYVAMNEKVFKYNEATKAYTEFLLNPNQVSIGRGSVALLESANKILLIGQPSVEGQTRRVWEIDSVSGVMVAASITGPVEALITYANGHALASDPQGNCLWFFRDDQHLYKLTRTGTAVWEATDFPLSGTPPELYASGVRTGNPGGVVAGIYNGFDYFPELKGLAWIQRTDRTAFYVRLYG